MNTASLIIRIICFLLIIVIGIVWLIGILSAYSSYKDSVDGYFESQDFKYYIFNRSQAFNFFAPILLIILGTYMIINTTLPLGMIFQEKRIRLVNQYKGLLDSGEITKEEFDAKKKQLLGL